MCCVYRMNRPAAGLTVVFCGRWSGKPGRNPQHGGCPGKNRDDMAGKIPAFSCRSPEEQKEVAAGSAYPAMQGMALWFQLCGLSVVCGLCRASILAGLALMQGYASPLRSPGPSFPSAVIFRSLPAQFRGLTLQLPSAVCVRLRLPLRPASPPSPGFYGGTAPPGVAEYVNNGGNHAICKPVTLNVEECDRLSFLPYLFGNDFLYAERLYVRAGEKMMPEYQEDSGTSSACRTVAVT